MAPIKVILLIGFISPPIVFAQFQKLLHPLFELPNSGTNKIFESIVSQFF